MKKMTYLLTLISLFTLTSCASYIERMHRQLDQEEGVGSSAQSDQFDQFRARPGQQMPNTSHPQFSAPTPRSSASTNFMSPQVKRDYRPMNEAKKRYNADDLTDSQNEASLWSGNGKGNYLFGAVDDKRNGDIVLIQVAGRLKNEITLELKRAFPDMAPPPKKAEGAEGGAAAEGAAAAAGPAPASNNEDEAAADPDKVYDRISSVIVEHINDAHLLLRGRKHVLYKSHKRLIEVQALVSRRDISSEDTVNSDRILETSIVVLR